MYKAFNFEYGGKEYVIPYKKVDMVIVDDKRNTISFQVGQEVKSFDSEVLGKETINELLDGYEDWLQE